MNNEKILDLRKALMDMNGDREIYDEVVSVFIEDTPNLLQSMENAWQEKDIVTLNRNAHSLKSSSRTIGGIKLGSIAAQLEAESTGEINSNIKELIRNITDEFNLLKQNLIQDGIIL